jgi:hypothetical protein
MLYIFQHQGTNSLLSLSLLLDPHPDPGKLPGSGSEYSGMLSPVGATINGKMYFCEWAINCVFFPYVKTEKGQVTLSVWSENCTTSCMYLGT